MAEPSQTPQADSSSSNKSSAADDNLPAVHSSPSFQSFFSFGSEKEDENLGEFRVFTVYLIRHGEAAHNVQEKIASERVLLRSVQAGLDPESEDVIQRMKEAREAILEDPTFFDAPLSDIGKLQAEDTASYIQEWTNEDYSVGNVALRPPTEIFVSPLQRTLQTAAILFPNHPNVRVREEIRERMTGRPADAESPLEEMQRRSTFRLFSFRHVQVNNLIGRVSKDGWKNPYRQKNDKDDSDDASGCSTIDDIEAVAGLESSLVCNEQGYVSSPLASFAAAKSTAALVPIEDTERLRMRTRKLFRLILHSKHESIAVVTHKAYLRELERGLLDQPNAKEFGNCEVRVYRLKFRVSPVALESAERLK